MVSFITRLFKSTSMMEPDLGPWFIFNLRSIAGDSEKVLFFIGLRIGLGTEARM